MVMLMVVMKWCSAGVMMIAIVMMMEIISIIMEVLPVMKWYGNAWGNDNDVGNDDDGDGLKVACLSKFVFFSTLGLPSYVYYSVTHNYSCNWQSSYVL